MCHLPVRDWRTKEAADRVISYVKRERKRRVGGVLGFTVSTPGAYEGHWWSGNG